MSQAASSDDKITLISDWNGTVTEQPAPASHGEGPVVTDKSYQQYLDRLAENPLLTDDNIRLSKDQVGGVRRFLGGAGTIGLAATLLGAAILNPFHALAAFEVGVFTALACSLGSLFVVMLFHILNVNWGITLRRQLENVASIIWVPIFGLLLITLIELPLSDGLLLQWLRPEHEGNYLLGKKAGFLNPGFFVIRVLIYGTVWFLLARTLASNSTDQDVTGDRMNSRRSRQIAGFGLLLFALTTAFAAFDFLMSMDFRFFSTMWGVYYFAGAAMSACALAAVITAAMRVTGRLNGVVTKEHYHDLGKLLFAFTVFWSYIAFSQYFLIWYGNIPEETAWFLFRKTGGWDILFILLIVGHFTVPLLVLISRNVKKATLGLAAFGVLMLVMQVFDMVFVIRPMVYIDQPWSPDPVGPAGWWLDIAGVIGVLGVFGYFLLGKITQSALIPIKDPRLEECLKHKNYV
ncbi:MAG: hypothetical protein AAGI17_01765 [Planctomycetota bacterium]